MKKIVLFTCLFLTSFFIWGQGLKAKGKTIVNSKGEEVILRGMGPGGWQIMEGYMMQSSGVAGSQHEIREKLTDLMGKEKTELFFEKWRENHFTKRDVDSLAAWGFNSIRLPMHYDLFTLPIEEEPIEGEHTWKETGFDIIDDLLEWCAPYNMYVILDMHATPGGQGTGSEINDYDPEKPSLWESQANKDKLIALWTRIAERYKDNQWIGGYDLINEPHWDLPGGTDLRNLYEDITEGIRSVDTKHILFIEGNWYANDHTGLTPPWDGNMVYSFHKYWSYTNENDLDWILPLRETHNVPLWMGEAGENSNTWFTDAVKLFEDNDIGWAWWTMRKVGDIDSPYAVDINPGYQKILDYWNGKAARPSEQETFDAMMQLADNLLVDNSRYRKDVPDALIRQVQTDETVPYHGIATEIPGIVFVPDFDLGRNNFAYYDTDAADYNLSTGQFQAWNSGWSYRNDGVDIEKNDDAINSNGFHVGFIKKGEWLKYSVNIKETGAYTAKVRYATQENGGKFHLELDDEAISTTHEVISTSGWTNFENYTIEDLLLEAGDHTLKIYFDDDIPINLSSIEFVKTGNGDDISFNAINGETSGNEKSIEIALNQPISTNSLINVVDQFSVMVNGQSRAITSINVDTAYPNTLILNASESFIYTDKVVVSYDGSVIKSETDKILNRFTDLEIRNTLNSRIILPGKLEVEAFESMVGLATEETTDDGGGMNIGYTDAGDSADYLIYIGQQGNYKVNFRVASEWATGKIGLYLVNDDMQETEVLQMETPVTGGWQTWTTLSSNLSLPDGIFTLRMKILTGGFNLNWIDFEIDNVINDDLDNDGVKDTEDDCLNTPQGAMVDVNGCAVFSLPNDNFELLLQGETCKSSNNGRISIKAKEKLNYTATLTGSTTLNKSFNAEVAFEDLESGNYDLCITIDEENEYQQCFSLFIEEPEELHVSHKTDHNSSKLKLSLRGSDSYLITFNDQLIRTFENEITLDLVQSRNTLIVKTDIDCQGIYQDIISFDNNPLVYPNPVTGDHLYVSTGFLYNSPIIVQVFSLTGNLISSSSYEPNQGNIDLDVTSIPRGIYILKIVTSNESYTHKIIR